MNVSFFQLGGEQCEKCLKNSLRVKEAHPSSNSPGFLLIVLNVTTGGNTKTEVKLHVSVTRMMLLKLDLPSFQLDLLIYKK